VQTIFEIRKYYATFISTYRAIILPIFTASKQQPASMVLPPGKYE
jgi:hypothetical protein